MKAHIIIEPDVEVGVRTLAACGKEHKVKVLWADVPKDATICRACVDAVLGAINEANDAMTGMLSMAKRVRANANLMEIIYAEANAMTDMIDRVTEYAEDREAEAERKAEEGCICLWTSPTGKGGEATVRVTQVDCPVHDTRANEEEPED